MTRLLSNPKALTVVVVLGALSLLGLAGGALGNEFGGGFLGAPLAHIQLAAEPLTAKPLFSGLPLFGDVHVTNTMLTTWVVILALAAVSYFGTRPGDRGARQASGAS